MIVFLLFVIFASISFGYEISPLAPPILHGEGPYWCPKSNTLYWVDTFNATLYRLLFPGKNPESFKIVGRDSVGFSLPIQGADDTFLVFADRTVYTLYWPRNLKLGISLDKHITVEPNKPTNQFNDGKVDCKGRVWGGTLKRNKDLSVSDNGGSLYVINKNLEKIEEKIQNTSISNGMAWSKDNKKYFYIDSPTRHIQQFDFDADSGKIYNQKIVFDLAHHPEIKGIPDGMTIDLDDNLWIALFGGGHILQVNPKSGKILQNIKMPVSYITSVAFGGANFSTLYATTSRLKLDNEKLEKEPLAGCVFAITDLGISGLPANEVILQ